MAGFSGFELSLQTSQIAKWIPITAIEMKYLKGNVRGEHFLKTVKLLLMQ